MRLWYANATYNIRLGMLVTIWTPHVSHCEHGNLSSRAAPLFTSIFPERDRSCHFLPRTASDDGAVCKVPHGYVEGRSLPDLMTLADFVAGGHDVRDARVLVCVKSVGAAKRVTPRNGTRPPTSCQTVQLFDSTHAAASLTLWGVAISSASAWQPSHTVLLLTAPGCRTSGASSTTYISLTSSTLVDVDPTIPDTTWLRAFAARLTRREDVNPPFPSCARLDVAKASSSETQILFTLGTLDAFARAAPHETFVGWLAVLLVGVELSALARRHMLLCGMHCTVPHYANAPSTRCRQCDAEITLRLNPRILGQVVDETGVVAAGKLVLSDEAWEQLLGRTKEEVCAMRGEELRALEQRMLYMRVSLGVAWWADEEDVGVGRLWIWAVR